MNETELKPCPICGNTPDDPIDATRILGVWRIVHRGCLDPNFAVERSTKDSAIAAWNARADLSDALVAAAYQDAANLHQSLWRETSAYKTDQIIKRTPADARTALDALLKAERENALREAASLSWLCFHKCDVEVDVVTVEDILALITKDTTDD